MATDAKSEGGSGGGYLPGSPGANGRKTGCCVCIVKPPVKLVVAGHVYTQGNVSQTHVGVYDCIWEFFGPRQHRQDNSAAVEQREESLDREGHARTGAAPEIRSGLISSGRRVHAPFAPAVLLRVLPESPDSVSSVRTIDVPTLAWKVMLRLLVSVL